MGPLQTLQVCDSEHSDGTSDGIKMPFVGFVIYFVVIFNICQMGLFSCRIPVTSHCNSALMSIGFSIALEY